jgi:hypothetical protein
VELRRKAVRLHLEEGLTLRLVSEETGVSLGVYRGQTAENVLEVYRRAVGQYGAPKEMLTDNGRQYASWQGKTHFQHALARDRVHHIRSAPHHPMTLAPRMEKLLDRKMARLESRIARLGTPRSRPATEKPAA